MIYISIKNIVWWVRDSFIKLESECKFYVFVYVSCYRKLIIYLFLWGK